MAARELRFHSVLPLCTHLGLFASGLGERRLSLELEAQRHTVENDGVDDMAVGSSSLYGLDWHGHILALGKQEGVGQMLTDGHAIVLHHHVASIELCVDSHSPWPRKRRLDPRTALAPDRR